MNINVSFSRRKSNDLPKLTEHKKDQNTPNELYFKLYQKLITKYYIQISDSFFNPYGGLGEGQIYEKVKKMT